MLAQATDELFGLVFRAKRFFDAQVALVALSTVLFLSLIVLLSIRLRASERETLYKIGCSRGTVAWMHVFELAIVFALSAALAGAASWLAVAQAPRILGWLVS